MSSTISNAVAQSSLSKLHQYQRQIVEFLHNKPKAALWVDMGLGKTISVLTFLGEAIALEYFDRVIVIAPKRVTQEVWPQEIEWWAHIDIDYEVIDGSADRRRIKIEEGATVQIIGKELVPWLVEEYRANWRWQCIVIDESSAFKSPKSKRFRALRKVTPLASHVIEMTGTPSPNSLMDLWSQAYLLDGGERLGPYITWFRKKFFNENVYARSFVPVKGAHEAVQKKLKDVVLRLAAVDHLDMPARFDRYHEVELAPELMGRYKEFERTFVARLKAEDVVASNKAVLSNKLIQFANGALYLEDKSWEDVHDHKIEMLKEIAESGQNLLVAYQYKSDLQRLKDAFPKAISIKDKGAIDRWNQGKISMLLAHPQSAGHGLNLQKGGNTIVWFSLIWSLEQYQQINARLYRQGQSKPVGVHHILAKDTIDKYVLSVLQGKESIQSALLRAMEELG